MEKNTKKQAYRYALFKKKSRLLKIINRRQKRRLFLNKNRKNSIRSGEEIARTNEKIKELNSITGKDITIT